MNNKYYMSKQSKHDTARETFPRLWERVHDKHAEEIADTERRLNVGYIDGDNPARDNKDLYIERHATARRWEQYQAGEITRDQIIRYTLNRYIKQRDKELAADIAKLERRAEVSAPERIDISIEWTRGGVYGMQARARVYAGHTYTGELTRGCGYNKISTAAASALNRSPEVMRVLCHLWEARAAVGLGMPVGVIGTALPSIGGGYGMSTITNILSLAGYTLTNSAQGRYYDYFSYYVK